MHLTLKGLLRLTLVGLVLALVLAAIFDPLSLNLPLFLATFGLLMALLCLSFVNYRKAEPLAIFTLYLCVIWLAFRAVYLNFRFESLNYQYLIMSNQQTVATSYILITAFSLILFMGIWVGSLIRLDGSRKLKGSSASEKTMIIFIKILLDFGGRLCIKIFNTRNRNFKYTNANLDAYLH